MIPLRAVIPSRTTPYITIPIIVLNALAWLFELSLPRHVLHHFLQVYCLAPAYFAWPTLVTLFLSWRMIVVRAIGLLGYWSVMKLVMAGAVAMAASTGRGGVAFMAEVAGFVCGIAAVFVFRKRQRPEQWWA